MTKVLNVSSAQLYWRVALFLLVLAVLVISSYFLIYHEQFVNVIVILFSCFFIPWSYHDLLDVYKLRAKQFQRLTIKEEHFLFEHLTQRGGEKISLCVAFININSIEVDKYGLAVEVVRRQNWIGVPQDFFIPMGSVPKLQRFVLPSKQRAEILNFLSNKGIDIKHKTKRSI